MKLFWIVFLLVVALLILAMLGFAITILCKKKGKFPEIHIGRSKEMAKKGITCAQTTDHNDRTNYHPIDGQNPIKDNNDINN